MAEVVRPRNPDFPIRESCRAAGRCEKPGNALPRRKKEPGRGPVHVDESRRRKYDPHARRRPAAKSKPQEPSAYQHQRAPGEEIYGETRNVKESRPRSHAFRAADGPNNVVIPQRLFESAVRLRGGPEKPRPGHRQD